MLYPFGRKFLFASNYLIAFLALTGCQAATVTAKSSSTSQAVSNYSLTRQMMIKFRPNTFACSAADIAQLSSATQLHLEYIRPMSGDACVIRLLAVSAIDIARVNELLRKHPAVEWLEPDSKKKAL